MPRSAEYHDLRRRGLCVQSCGRAASGSKCGACKAKERRRALKRLKDRVKTLEERQDKMIDAIRSISGRLLALEPDDETERL